MTTLRVLSLLSLLSLLLGLLTAGLTVGTASSAPAAPPPPSAAEGQTLFQQKCLACHTIGQGDRIGPDLRGVTTRRDRAWLTRWIVAPDQVLSRGDPVAAESLEKYGVPMPNLGLTESEAAALLTYLERAAAGESPAAGASAPQPVQPPAAALAAGNPVVGKDLFTGAFRLRNGGPPCLACHSVAGLSALGGGALGPDLTPAYSRFGGNGVASILATMPFPTMKPIFGSRPLTPDEQADLRAFFQQTAVTGRPPQAVVVLTLLAAAGAALLLALVNVIWRRRLTAVRRPLVTRG